MPEIRKCLHCQTELPPDAPDGVCPQCLLRLGFAGQSAGDQPAASELGYGSRFASATPPFNFPGRFIPPSPADLAPHFPQLEIDELLGSGGMGAVYKARQRRLDRPVALKVLPPEVAGAPGFADRFTREARALARLNHPHVVAVHDFGEAGGMFYFVMEYVDGANLRNLIAARTLKPQEALGIVPQLCEALQYAHDEGIVHRDIKPENILLDRKGRVKIADFGLAKLLRGSDAPAGRAAYTLTGSQQVMGTPHYMAPEQMEKPQGVDHRADIYSLGVVFYEMLTGELPLGRFAPPSRKVSIDVRLDEVVLRTLEKEPELRYQHASEVRNDVETISHAAPPPPSWPAGFEPDSDLDGLHFKDARSQVSLPAVGLGLVGGIGFIVSFIALVVLLNWGNAPYGVLIDKIVLAALTVWISLMIAAGGSAMARLKAYGLCRAASILAVLPFHAAWLIGMPAGICAWTVLSRPDVQAAFRGKRSPKGPGSLAANALTVAYVIAACFLIAAVLLVVTFISTPASIPPAQAPMSMTPAPMPVLPRQELPPLPTLPVISRPWTLGPSGPALSRPFADHILRLTPQQQDRVNKILQHAYEAGLTIEAKNIEQHVDHESGHLVITIRPYPGLVAKLEDQLWSQLDDVLDRQQQSIARLNLDLDPRQPRDGIPLAELFAPGFFGWGKEGARLELWRVGKWYHWKIHLPGGREHNSSNPQLPLQYRRFWKEPASDSTKPD